MGRTFLILSSSTWLGFGCGFGCGFGFGFGFGLGARLLDLELVDVVVAILGDHREERGLARGELELLLRRAVAVPGEG